MFGVASSRSNVVALPPSISDLICGFDGRQNCSIVRDLYTYNPTMLVRCTEQESQLSFLGVRRTTSPPISRPRYIFLWDQDKRQQYTTVLCLEPGPGGERISKKVGSRSRSTLFLIQGALSVSRHACTWLVTGRMTVVLILNPSNVECTSAKR